MDWQVFISKGSGERVLTGLVEGDAELVSRLKLLAADLKLAVEVVEVTNHRIPPGE